MKPAGSLLHRLPVRPARQGRPERVLLELDLTRGLGEHPATTPVQALRSMRTPQLRTVVENLRRAETDADVVGLVATVGAAPITLAQSAELRTAVAGLRRAGKATVAFSPSFGELGPGTTGYHLASAFEQVWLQPSGAVGLVGFAAEAVFLREALDKAGVEPQFAQRYEFKSAADMLMRSGMSEPVRQMYTRLIESATQTVVADVAESRGLTPQTVHAALREAPLAAERAVAVGLVDHLGYRDEAYAAARRDVGEPTRLRYVERRGPGRLEALLDRVPSLPTTPPLVALVHAGGPIALGRGGPPSPFGGPTVGSDTLGAALRSVAQDERVVAVVLRVDSPGGSYVASDAIRREVLALRETGRPVVASMGSVAASGGYYIAMACSRILAGAGTVTGSIGVLAGKAVLRAGLERLGVHRQTIAGSPRAAMFSSNQAFDDDQLAALDAWLDAVYADFTAKAAADRGMDVEALRAVAKGRVWSGADALGHGLVDRIGGLSEAVDVACSLAGTSRGRVRVGVRPAPNPLAALRPAHNSDDVRLDPMAHLDEGPQAWRMLAARIGQVTGAPVTGVLSLMPVRLPGLLPATGWPSAAR